MLVATRMNNEIPRFMNKLSTDTQTIRAVALDMDGLMLNTEDLYQQVGISLLQRRGKEYREVVRQKMIGLPAPQAFGVLIEAEGLKETWQELQRETDELFEEILPDQLALMPGIEEFLDHLDTIKIPRCVATSSSRSFATKALGMMNVLQRLDFVIVAEDVTRGKPYPDIYLSAAARLGVPVEEMLVLEDSSTGTQAGVSAGAYVVSVPNEHTRGSVFAGSRWIADTMKDPRLKKLLPNKS
jgi:HAD superfamily hydrolase (TIGR01509 family)